MFEKNKLNQDVNFKAGFVAICGKPNAGKSTLLNHFLGEKLAITTPKPQTTRNRIRGILNLPQGQIIFTDTPGILMKNKARRQKVFQDFLRQEAVLSLEGADALLYLIDAQNGFTEEDQKVWDHLKGRWSGVTSTFPILMGLNKVDALGDKTKLLKLAEQIVSFTGVNNIFPCSAKKGTGTQEILAHLLQVLPVSPALYPEDLLSDQNDRFLVAEIIREKIFGALGDELPYSSAVRVENFKDGPSLLRLEVDLFVERDSQKGMVIGKGGQTLKKIGSRARMDLEALFKKKVFLHLQVKILKNWAEDAAKLKLLGYVLPPQQTALTKGI